MIYFRFIQRHAGEKILRKLSDLIILCSIKKTRILLKLLMLVNMNYILNTTCNIWENGELSGTW